MFVLLFLVIGVERLCVCWVDSMREHDLDCSEATKAEFVQRLRLPEAHPVTWIQIHLIGKLMAELMRLFRFVKTYARLVARPLPTKRTM